jgi:hypothetical protein
LQRYSSLPLNGKGGRLCFCSGEGNYQRENCCREKRVCPVSSDPGARFIADIATVAVDDAPPILYPAMYDQDDSNTMPAADLISSHIGDE